MIEKVDNPYSESSELVTHEKIEGWFEEGQRSGDFNQATEDYHYWAYADDFFYKDEAKCKNNKYF